MLKKIFSKKNFYILGAIFIAIFFFYICYKTPLAGDDWGYALNGRNGNILETLINQYNSWSGRIFSELWGYLIAPRKELWNILNPLFFVLIFVGVYKLIRVKYKYLMIPLIIIVLMLTIENNIRMETYTWIMGSTYVIPLCLSVWYLVIIDNLFRRSLISKRYLFSIVLSNIFLFIIGLMMENIAAAMLLGIIILIIYSYFNNRKIMKYLIINLIVISTSFVICRLSPGSAYRLARDHAEWSELNIFEKIVKAFPNFLDMTFIRNKYIILSLGIAMIGLLYSKRRNIKLYILIPSLLIQLLSIFNVFSYIVLKENNIFINPQSIYSMVFWILYIFDLFIILLSTIEKGLYRDKTIFVLLIAGACSGAMLMSPIYGSRSALFTVYYIIVLTCLITDQISLNKITSLIIICILVIFIIRKTNYYINLYKEVGLKQEERLMDIDYYQNHPEEKEVWIKRFGDGVVHGADINPDDIYHLETFKEYYELPQEAKNIIFYFEDK